MGNQQERLEMEKNWFAGFFEGEGYVSLCRNSQTSERQKGQYRYTPSCGFCNTDYQFLPLIERLLNSENIPYVKYHQRCTGLGKKPKWEIAIHGIKKCQTFLRWISPYFVGNKRDRANQVLRFCNIRLEKLSKFHRAPYGDEEHSIYSALYQYKGRTKSKILNDYMPNTSCSDVKI